jgi:hypothetical protein
MPSYLEINSALRGSQEKSMGELHNSRVFQSMAESAPAHLCTSSPPLINANSPTASELHKRSLKYVSDETP